MPTCAPGTGGGSTEGLLEFLVPLLGLWKLWAFLEVLGRL